MNKDAELLAEAYQRVLEEAKHCKAAIDGCDCDKCEECEENQTVSEAKKSRRPDAKMETGYLIMPIKSLAKMIMPIKKVNSLKQKIESVLKKW
jgi:methionyl-tRNA synthetase